MELDALIRALAPSDVIGGRPVEIAELAYDTRRVREGALFFCVPGATRDGHELAGDALAAGAVALVVEHPVEAVAPQLVVESVRASMAVAADVFFGAPTERLTVAGVTGTNGKTTTTFLLRSILEAAGQPTGLVGTVEWVVGGAGRAAPHTTPEAIELQRLFREMLDAGDTAVAVEASSHGSHYRRLDRVRFDALCFTNLTSEHLDLHGDMESYFQAKRRLFTGLTPPPAAVNVGDPYGRRLADELAGAHRAPLVTYGLRPEAEIRADGLEVGPHGSSFTAAGLRIETPLLGVFNVENVLGAVASATLLDIDDEAIVEGIRAVTGVPGRFEAVDEGQAFAVVVDYAHKPDALASALRAARELGPGRLTVVFGAGGDRDRSKRPQMGRIARELADRVIVTNDNPRSEEPLAIVAEILQGAGTDVEIDLDRGAAIESAIAGASAGDVVLIAGKGHEHGQESAGVVHPFDDREVARAALARLHTRR
ncbi:MAG TPA: UDP-N-acetylmuramoyl-L-alanyl-D-glutamate--2,6-diaminopimelate ligase [Gaiella sp.]|nr:UDP-N-acetylmuramoyl-L-alanyl-D-glutamate--2,6-diaminopimelate ligase [Gaiella sp.]